MSSQWVQHISGQGEKYRVSILDIPDWAYAVDVPTLTGTRQWYLPKSEYRLCEPPEQWVDITEDSRVHNNQLFFFHNGESLSSAVCRVRKVQLWTVQPHTNIIGEMQWAFVIERKQP